jgi:hypothetical protein
MPKGRYPAASELKLADGNAAAHRRSIAPSDFDSGPPKAVCDELLVVCRQPASRKTRRTLGSPFRLIFSGILEADPRALEELTRSGRNETSSAPPSHLTAPLCYCEATCVVADELDFARVDADSDRQLLAREVAAVASAHWKVRTGRSKTARRGSPVS